MKKIIMKQIFTTISQTSGGNTATKVFDLVYHDGWMSYFIMPGISWKKNYLYCSY